MSNSNLFFILLCLICFVMVGNKPHRCLHITTNNAFNNSPQHTYTPKNKCSTDAVKNRGW